MVFRSLSKSLAPNSMTFLYSLQRGETNVATLHHDVRRPGTHTTSLAGSHWHTCAQAHMHSGRAMLLCGKIIVLVSHDIAIAVGWAQAPAPALHRHLAATSLVNRLVPAPAGCRQPWCAKHCTVPSGSSSKCLMHMHHCQRWRLTPNAWIIVAVRREPWAMPPACRSALPHLSWIAPLWPCTVAS